MSCPGLCLISHGMLFNLLFDKSKKRSFLRFPICFGTFFRLNVAINAMLDSGHANLKMHNNRVLTVDLVNTGYNETDSDKRAQIAEDIANYLLAQIEGEQEFEAIDTIVVGFVHYEKKYLVVDFTRTIDHYEFQVVDREEA